MSIADKPGVYKDFSGRVKWRHPACVVRNADFEILENGDKNGKHIIFTDAVFVSGEVWCSVIKNGLNLGCDFYSCRIEYMFNKGGMIFGGAWLDGIFEGGIFRYSIWYDGIWISGVWDKGENSIGELMESTPDKWEENKL